MKTKKIKRIVGIEPGAPGPHVFSYSVIPRLGLPLIGTILKHKGCDVRIYCSDLNRIDWDDVWHADLVLISTITNTTPTAYRMAEKIRNRDIPVVMGGPHVSFKPAEALKFADYVVRGEGEETIVELLKYLKTENYNNIFNIKGLSFRMEDKIYHNPPRTILQDLDALPSPDLSLIDEFEKTNVVPIITSRGCPFNCTFCLVTKIFGRKYRFRSNPKVIEEIENLYQKFPNKHFFFYDDNFTANTWRTKELLKEILKRQVDIGWSAQTRADVVKDESLIALMRRAGCQRLYIGFESINPETLKAYKKSQTVEDIEECVKILHKHDIGVHGMFVFGGDDDDIETINNTVDFAFDRKIETVQFLILTPLPGTVLYQEMLSQKRIIDEKWSEYDGHHVKFKPKKISAWELQVSTMLKAMVKFYSLWECMKLFFKGNKLFLTKLFGRWLLWRWRRNNRHFLKDLKKINNS